MRSVISFVAVVIIYAVELESSTVFARRSASSRRRSMRSLSVLLFCCSLRSSFFEKRRSSSRAAMKLYLSFVSFSPVSIVVLCGSISEHDMSAKLFE